MTTVSPEALVLTYILVLALTIGIVYVVAILSAYRNWRAAIRETLLAKKVSVEQALKLIKPEMLPLIPGFGRILLVISIVLLLGIGIFHIVTFGLPTDQAGVVEENSAEIARLVMTALGTVLTAVVAFYFASKSTADKVLERFMEFMERETQASSSPDEENEGKEWP